MYLDRVKLMNYSKLEEIINSLSHFLGVVFGFVALAMTLHRSLKIGNPWQITSSLIYGISLVLLYSASGSYHASPRGKVKKILRIIDRSMIFLLIAGSVTPYALVAIRPENPLVAWLVLGISWAGLIFGVLVTVINLEKSRKIQMFLYIFIGWISIFAIRDLLEIFDKPALFFLFSGGISYTIGAIVCGIGKKVKYFHCIFHGFVLLGSVLHFIGIYKYVLV